MKTALVVGMAKSGVGAAKLLSRTGWRVIANDRRREIPGLDQALAGFVVAMRLGEAPEALLDGVELVVISPVIPMTAPFVRLAQTRGIEVISEIELGYRYAKARFVCITGTNGKTTCTALTGAMFQKGYREGRTFVLGNIGVAITEHALDTAENDIVVAETAALQLEGNARFHASAAGICNITEDHIDHFGSMESYIAAKCKIFDNQTETDYAVLNYDDPQTRAIAGSVCARRYWFSRREEVGQGMFLRDGVLIFRDGGRDAPLLHRDEIRIPGAHNLENAMLSALLALCMGVSPAAVVETLKTFPGVEHRLEFVRELDGVAYINDSKGTNPASTMRAIEAMDRPIVLILGGYDKHADFSELFRSFGGAVKACVILGQTKSQLLTEAEAEGCGALCHPAERFEDAVRLARSLSRPGDAVLLSPACASWDMFENFEERGRVFKELVNAFV